MNRLRNVIVLAALLLPAAAAAQVGIRNSAHDLSNSSATSTIKKPGSDPQPALHLLPHAAQGAVVAAPVEPQPDAHRLVDLGQ
jgi:hypothetical protein